MGKMYRHDDYIEFKNKMMGMDESNPDYHDLLMTGCLMEILVELSPSSAAAGILTALEVVYNDNDRDDIIGFLTTMCELERDRKKAVAEFEAGKVKKYIDNDISAIIDLFNSDNEFGEGGE